MSTARSWTTELRDGVADLRSLLGFRWSTLSREARRRLLVGAGLAGVLTALIVTLAIGGPLWIPERLNRSQAGNTLALLPAGLLAFAVLAVVGAVSAGGGRELLPREQLVAYPVSTLTEHLAALLIAPLNIGWFLQTWTLLGATAYAFGTHGTALALIPVLVAVALATALGQVVGWVVEGLRRGARGVWVVRTLTLLGVVALVALVVTGRLAGLLDHAPTSVVLDLAFDGAGHRWLGYVVGLAVMVLLLGVVVAMGWVAAAWALSRPEQQELRLESGVHPARATSASDFAAVLRLDRASVWRSVPLRRGVMVLTLLPGLVALLGRMDWAMLSLMPGLAAAGAALLFGVNAWCLDGRGALWRDSLPVEPVTVHRARTTVLLEMVLLASSATTALASIGAILGHGSATAGELVSVACAVVVTAGQVCAASMRWSVASPYAVDLRSARATPAPPGAMIGYSARLALVTTLTAMVFSGCAAYGDPRLPLLLSVAFVARSALVLLRVERAWQHPGTRSAVIAAVAA